MPRWSPRSVRHAGATRAGTDHAALPWFELQKVGTGSWTVVQEGLVGGEAGVHRSVGAIAMDGSGNIALGHTRAGVNAPYYPSMYYTGRQSTDPPGTMPARENVIADATTSKTNNKRWGDYAAMGIDPGDDCTFWFTSEYSGQGLEPARDADAVAAPPAAAGRRGALYAQAR